MEDHPNDQATAGDGPEAARGRPRRSSRAPATARDEPDGARVLPRRSTRVDVQDPGFEYTAWRDPPGEFSLFLVCLFPWVCLRARVGGFRVFLGPS